MAQQLNLFDARFAPQALRFSARHGLLALGLVLAASLAASHGLRWAEGRASAEAQTVLASLATLRAQQQARSASAPVGTEAELAQLRTLDAGQRRIGAALDAGLAGAREGHADYLVALARKASAALWITGFSVAEDGGAIELTGRMADASVLSDYLRSLNAEPRFKGRPFAQLSLRAVDSTGAALPYTEFALRSSAGNAVASASITQPPTSSGP